jgi:hypothetical protein
MASAMPLNNAKGAWLQPLLPAPKGDTDICTGGTPQGVRALIQTSGKLPSWIPEDA